MEKEFGVKLEMGGGPKRELVTKKRMGKTQGKNPIEKRQNNYGGGESNTTRSRTA